MFGEIGNVMVGRQLSTSDEDESIISQRRRLWVTAGGVDVSN